MSTHLDEIARVQFESEFGSHANEVLDSGWMATPQLQMQTVQATPPQRGWRPEFGDPEAYLQSVYNCLQQ